MSGFFSELRRRKVYRVAAVYGVVAWLIIQVAATVFPAWELPAWSLRLVIALVLIGFPIALILAWAFDFTPSGIRAEGEVPPGAAFSASGVRRRSNLFLLGGFGMLVAAVAGFFLLPRAEADRIDKSIAVLPFENLSDDKENAFFADGIQEDVLTNLSKISDLKVISRTSVMPYRGQRANVRDIARALGVGAVLEGSVRRDGNRVRINVQLINGRNDQHIWSEIYDRDLTNVFAIQSDLAREIASALRMKLSPGEKAQLERPPTENSEAYLVYLQARDLHRQLQNVEKLKQAEHLYERATQLDPNFALAFAHLSHLQSWIFQTHDPVPARRERARLFSERALQLQPDCPEAHFARGFFYYYGDRNYDAALKEFAIAEKAMPSQAEVYLAIGAIQRRQGRWLESTANLERAATLDPKNTWPLQNLAFNYQMTRNFTAANATLERALKVDPKSFSIWLLKSKYAIEATGDLSAAERSLSTLESLATGPDERVEFAGRHMSLLLLQRNYDELLREVLKYSDADVDLHPEASVGKYLVEGMARLRLQDEAGARAALLKAKARAERFVREAPNDPARHSRLAEVLASLGEKEAAIAEAKRAIELRPESADAFDGPVYTAMLAQVYAILGEQDAALDLFDGLLARPSWITVALLKIVPAWDNLREHPCFSALLAKYGARG